MRVECVTCPLLALLILCICKYTVAEIAVATGAQLSTFPLPKNEDINNHKQVEKGGDGKKLIRHTRTTKYLYSPHPDDSLLIATRRVRKLGSEFLGKRSAIAMNEGKARIQKRAMGSEFLGKRRSMGSEFLGKRGPIQYPQIDEYPSSETGDVGFGLDWTRLTPVLESESYPETPLEPIQKKSSNNVRRASDYIGKRRMHEFPQWKQSLNTRMIQFDKKRRVMGSEFLGKRSSLPEQGELTQFESEKVNF